MSWVLFREASMRTLGSLLLIGSLAICGVANANFIFTVHNTSTTSTDSVYIGAGTTPVATVAPGETSKKIATATVQAVIVKSSNFGTCEGAGADAAQKLTCSDRGTPGTCGCTWF